MKSFCLSLCCLILTLWFWNAQYEDTQLVHHMQQTLSVLQEKRLAKTRGPLYRFGRESVGQRPVLMAHLVT